MFTLLLVLILVLCSKQLAAAGEGYQQHNTVVLRLNASPELTLERRPRILRPGVSIGISFKSECCAADASTRKTSVFERTA
jgi:hypothetical protein